MTDHSKLPPEIVSYWPEIFKDIEVKAIPVEYINSINVVLTDGSVWTVDIDREKEAIDVDDVEQLIEEILEEHEDEIESVDFSLDTEQIKIDIKKRTNIFMKKRK